MDNKATDCVDDLVKELEHSNRIFRARSLELRKLKKWQQELNKVEQVMENGYGWYEPGDIPKEFHTTIYFRHREIVEKLASGNLSEEFLFMMKHMAKRRNMDAMNFTFFLRCKGVIRGRNYCRILLEDPFGEIETTPITETNFCWQNLPGKMIRAKIRIHFNTDTYELIKLEVTNFNYEE